jgi:hypothetical protein
VPPPSCHVGQGIDKGLVGTGVSGRHGANAIGTQGAASGLDHADASLADAEQRARTGRCEASLLTKFAQLDAEASLAEGRVAGGRQCASFRATNGACVTHTK